MSSILDALKKAARRKDGSAYTISSKIVADNVYEQRLLDEKLKHHYAVRRIFMFSVIAVIVTTIVVIATGIFIVWGIRSNRAALGSSSSVVALPTKPTAPSSERPEGMHIRGDDRKKESALQPKLLAANLPEQRIEIRFDVAEPNAQPERILKPPAPPVKQAPVARPVKQPERISKAPPEQAPEKIAKVVPEKTVEKPLEPVREISSAPQDSVPAAVVGTKAPPIPPPIPTPSLKPARKEPSSIIITVSSPLGAKEPAKKPIPKPAPVVKTTPKPKPASPSEALREEYRKLHLEGIIWDKKRPMALVNQQIVETGEEIEGFVIRKIKKTSLEVEKEGYTFDLRY